MFFQRSPERGGKTTKSQNRRSVGKVPMYGMSHPRYYVPHSEWGRTSRKLNIPEIGQLGLASGIRGLTKKD